MVRARCAAPGLLAALAAVGEAILLENTNTKTRDVSLFDFEVEEDLESPPRIKGITPDVFRKKFEKIMSEQPPPPDSPKDDGLQVLVGIFSNATVREKPFRDVARNTWMDQPGVCALGKEEGPQEGCSVYVTFVVPGGKEGGRIEKGRIVEGQIVEGRSEGNHVGDMSILPMPESMSCQKIPFWFYHAYKKFPWATHVVKMDIDAFPHVQELLASIRRGPTGRKCSQHPQDIYGGRAGEKACLRGMCWQSMQRGLYFMSTELAKKVAKPGSWWHEESRRYQDQDKPCRPEEVITGEAVLEHVMLQGECVNRIDFEGREYEM